MNETRTATGERVGVSVAVRGLHIRYGGGAKTAAVHALGPLDIEIPAGQFVSVVGPSGCGKSTLLKAVAGLITASEGSIEVGGRPVNEPLTSAGIVFQKPLLMDWRTVIENVMLQAQVRRMDLTAARTKAHELLQASDLADFADRRPYELSGGMQQRVGICRALLHDPPIILMDEPFGALDALTREQMAYYLQDTWMKTRATVLFITHSIQEALLLSDRVVVMSARPGRIQAQFEIAEPRPRREGSINDSAEIRAIEQQIRNLLIPK